MGEMGKILDASMAATAVVSAEAWLQKAHEDWGAVEVILCAAGMDDIALRKFGLDDRALRVIIESAGKQNLLYVACHHVHHAAEKALKAALELDSVPIKKQDGLHTHKLWMLRRRLQKDGGSVWNGVLPDADCDEFIVLSRYAIDTKYPGASDQPPTHAEARELMNFVAGRVVAPVAQEVQRRLGLVKQSALNASADAQEHRRR